MELLTTFIDIILHLDVHLAALTAQYGTWIYAILFLIIFCETGLVVFPFLPGDSLLFVAGALAATGGMDIWVLCGVLLTAAVLISRLGGSTIGCLVIARLFGVVAVSLLIGAMIELRQQVSVYLRAAGPPEPIGA